MARVVASGSGPRSAAKWISFGAVLGGVASGALWLASNQEPSPKPAATSAPVNVPPRPPEERPLPTAPLARAGSSRVERAPVVTAAFNATRAPAVALADRALSFSSEGEELRFWQSRAPGEALTLESLETSEQALTRVLEAKGATTPEKRASLEQRRETLRAKLAMQRTRVEQMQSRIAELERVGGSK